ATLSQRAAENRSGHDLLFLSLRKGSGTIGLASGASAELAPRAQHTDDRRQEGKNDDNRNHVMDALRNVGNQMAEKITAKDHGPDPEDAAKNIERQVAPIRHLRRARHRRTKRSHDGHKARENHGSSAILFVKIMRALQMAASKKQRIFAPVE